MGTKDCECGRKIIVRRHHRKKRFGAPRDRDRTLCRKCLKAERDRTLAVQVKSEELSNGVGR